MRDRKRFKVSLRVSDRRSYHKKVDRNTLSTKYEQFLTGLLFLYLIINNLLSFIQSIHFLEKMQVTLTSAQI